MDLLRNWLALAGIDLARAQLVLLLLLLALMLFFSVLRARAQIRAGIPIRLRRLGAYTLLRNRLEESAETARPLHVSAGSGGIGGGSTIESLAGLNLLDHAARSAAVYEAQPIVTVGDATLLAAAQDTVRRAYIPDDAGRYEPSDVRLVAPERAGYGAGTLDLIEHKPASAQVLVGAFGAEYLLLAEPAAQSAGPVIAGAADPSVLPFIAATADEALLGEELFTAGAYLGGSASQLGGLAAQDWVRVLIVLGIVAGVVVRSLS